MSNIDDDFIIIDDEYFLNHEYNSNKICISDIYPSLPEKHWNNKIISKSLNKWRKLRYYDLLVEIATSYIKKKQYLKAFKYWKNSLKKFTKLDISYDNDIIIENKSQNINNKEKEESKLFKKDSCINSCIDLIFENFISPLKDFFDEITNYYNNFINSF